MSRGREFLKALASGNAVKISVRGIVLSRGRALVQKPTGDPDACYAFIGGLYELGDTFVSRLRQEFEEETNAKIVDCEYLFVVENQWLVDGRVIQLVEHFLAATLDREDIESREKHLSQHWLPVASLKDYDLRPWIVRDVVAEGRLHSVRHLIAPPDDEGGMDES
jgi:ADP-ribose pyrophosphatase YjhB (NUDIX family)